MPCRCIWVKGVTMDTNYQLTRARNMDLDFRVCIHIKLYRKYSMIKGTFIAMFMYFLTFL